MILEKKNVPFSVERMTSAQSQASIFKQKTGFVVIGGSFENGSYVKHKKKNDLFF